MATSQGRDGGSPSIRFVIPYFGQWPFWFDFFLESCRRNPSIDWLLFTDCSIPVNVPTNVQFISISFADYCSQVSTRLGIDFSPSSAYKLCDIKPALGAVHADVLQGYDFWAFGDIDVVYGNLRRYFNDERLRAKDLFATHHRRISGHLCLLRNTPQMRDAFRLIPNWQRRYGDETHQALDEGAFSRIFIRHKNWPEPLRKFFARFNDWSQRSEFIEAHSTYTLHADGRRVVADTWFYRDGRLTNSEQGDQELPYLHFMVWKNEAWKGVAAEHLIGPPNLHLSESWQVGPKGWQAITVDRAEL